MALVPVTQALFAVIQRERGLPYASKQIQSVGNCPLS